MSPDTAAAADHLPLGDRLATRLSGIEPLRLSRIELFEQCVDPGADVVPDEPHALEAVDAAFGRFVGVPVLQRAAGGNVDGGVTPEGDDEVDVAEQIGVEGFGVSPVRSTPTSARACADSALISSPGFVPAEWTSTRSPAALRMSPAAIWDFPRCGRRRTPPTGSSRAARRIIGGGFVEEVVDPGADLGTDGPTPRTTERAARSRCSHRPVIALGRARLNTVR
jgi:hypothetical protein